MVRPRGPVRWLHHLGFRRPRPEDSVAWEIEHHLSEVVDRLVAEGWDDEPARAEAERQFGDRRRYGPSMKRMEKGRAAMERRTEWWDFVQGGVLGVYRTARRYPGFAMAVVFTLALGIGANATMYGIVDRLLLQPPAHIVNADDVRLIFQERPSSITGETITQPGLTYPDYADLKAHDGLSVAAFTSTREETVGSGETATRARIAYASSEFFPLLGVQPTFGRFYGPDESAVGAQLTAVLADEYWERAYGSDPGVLGRTIELGGRTHEIIGVAPAGFTGVHLTAVDVWLPLEATHVASNGVDWNCLESRGCWWMSAVARLGEGITTEVAEAEATRLHINARREMIDEGRWSEDARILLVSVIAADGPNQSDEARVVRWLAGVSVVVLLIACANVANLFLARGTRQRREVAVRLALGVTRGRLVGQMVMEAVLLSLVGGGVALLLARWGGEFVRRVLLPGVFFPDSAVNARVLGFALVASIIAGLMAGLGPALQESRADVTSNLGDAARGSSGARSRLRGFLTVTQAALSVVLLVGAGLFARSLGELRDLDLGLDVDRVLLAQIEFRNPNLEEAEQTRLYEEAAQAVTGLPSVESAAATSVPFQWVFSSPLSVPHLDSIPRLPGGGPYYYPVTPGYFETVGLRITGGRAIGASDGPDDQKVTVVSATMAITLWPNADPLGQCILIGRDSGECTTVIGVVENAAQRGFQDEAVMAYYLPISQRVQAPRGLYVRTSPEARTAASDVASLLRSFSPEVRYATVQSLEEMLDPQARSWTLGASMFTVFGLLALVLAAIGLYSVLAFDVAQRTRELGIRTALGAEKWRLLTSVLFHGGRLAVLGVVIGLGTAYLAAPFATDLLFQVSPRDPATFAAVAFVLIAVSTAASVVPGVRATRVDPMVSLRAE
ncbi:MAG: ABC transporter permease [Gemmatimonadetes bacterium]|nr:ABC transporter permease [Gemmatimonadota bacterium]